MLYFIYVISKVYIEACVIGIFGTVVACLILEDSAKVRVKRKHVSLSTFGYFSGRFNIIE